MDKKFDIGWVIVSLAIVILVTFVFYLAHSFWAFLALAFIPSRDGKKQISVTCPKCGHEFQVEKKKKPFEFRIG